MMKLPLILSLVFVALLGCSPSHSQEADLAKLFQQAGVIGTFVLLDVEAGRTITHNHPRSRERFVPASTFKIPNSMIGLAVGAVSSVDEVLPYGGQPQPFAAWEQDMALREAIVASSVPVYQELARRIGLERMRESVSRLGFGNEDIGTSVDTFWLEGPLKISAVEQARFMAKLAQGQLPLSAAIQQSVRDMVLLEHGEHWTLFGKTGWQNVPGPGVGWWVGWVQKHDRVYAFALNIDIREPADASKRVELGKASLKALGVLP